MFQPFVPLAPIDPLAPVDPLTPAEVMPGPATPTASPPTPRRGRRGTVGLLMASAFLSAALASGATAALVTRPSASLASIPATTQASTTGIVTVATTTSPSIASIAAGASPAVVTIQTTVSAQAGVARGRTGAGVGSGFIYAADGYILTAAHVVEGASQITVTLADGRTYAGTVASTDASVDVAVVKIAATGLPTVQLGITSTLEVGQTVIALGDPLGELPGSVSVGIVSAWTAPSPLPTT